MRLALPLLMLTLATPAWSASPAKPLTAEEIVARHVEAIGGQAKVDAVQNLVIRGTYIEGEHRGDAVLARMRPYYKIVGDPEHPSKDFAEGYDGSAWEFYGDPGIVLRTVGAASAAGRHGTAVLGPLIDYKAMGTSLTLVGTEPIAGKPAYQIRLKLRDGFEQDEFIDAKSFMMVAERKVMPIHAFGEKVSSETRFSDFRPVAGVLMYFREEEVEIATGKVLNQFIRNAVDVNRPLKPEQFSPPVFAHTPPQTLIETLFLTRDDPEATMWSYFDFRRANPGADTDETMRIAGFQILKAGQNQTAIRVLAQNAKDYPNSSPAAFSLGRALATAGHKEEAKAEFRRALKLDPKNDRAAAALKAAES